MSILIYFKYWTWKFSGYCFIKLGQQTFQRCFDVGFRLIWCRDLIQRQINVAYLNVDLNNVRHRRNNVVTFNIDLHNVEPRRNNVVNMTIKNKLRVKSIIILRVSIKIIWRYTNADLKIYLFVLIRAKRIPWKFCILNPKNPRVILP